MSMITTRRGLLAGIPAIAATTMAPAAAKALSGLPAPVSDDPIFAAIESHTQAVTDLNAIPGDLRWEMTAPEWDAFWTASETEPTTEGAVALLEYLLSPYLGESSMLCHAFELWAGNGYESSEDDEYITAPEWQASIIKAIRKKASSSVYRRSGDPRTVGDMRALGLRSVYITCCDCGSASTLNVDDLDR